MRAGNNSYIFIKERCWTKNNKEKKKNVLNIVKLSENQFIFGTRSHPTSLKLIKLLTFIFFIYKKALPRHFFDVTHCIQNKTGHPKKKKATISAS